jgi:hypothetical protein
LAENEILYVAGASRWRATRRALRNGASAEAVAQCFADDMDRGLRSSLIATFRRGETLLTLFRATCQDPIALRAVVRNFQDRQLARIVREAVKMCGPNDPLTAARYAGNLIGDQIAEQTLLYAGQCDAYSTPAARAALSEALTASIERYKPELMAILETSMRGHRVRGPKRQPVTRASTQLKAKSVIETSLLPPGVGQHNVLRRR